MFGKRLKKAREAAGYSVAELAQKLHVGSNTVWRWEQDERTPSDKDKLRLAEVLSTSVSYLIGENPEFPRTARPFSPEEWYELPILDPSAVACAGNGNGMHSVQFESSQKIWIPREWLGIISVDADKKPYGVHVEGDSMVEAGIPDGADVAVNPAEEVREGDAALVCFGQHGDWAVKWVHFHRDGSIELRSSSSQYPVKVFPREDVENGFLKVIGRITRVITSPKRNI